MSSDGMLHPHQRLDSRSASEWSAMTATISSLKGMGRRPCVKTFQRSSRAATLPGARILNNSGRGGDG